MTRATKGLDNTNQSFIRFVSFRWQAKKVHRTFVHCCRCQPASQSNLMPAYNCQRGNAIDIESSQVKSSLNEWNRFQNIGPVAGFETSKEAFVACFDVRRSEASLLAGNG